MKCEPQDVDGFIQSNCHHSQVVCCCCLCLWRWCETEFKILTSSFLRKQIFERPDVRGKGVVKLTFLIPLTTSNFEICTSVNLDKVKSKKMGPRGGSPGLVVMGDDSFLEGRGFESRHHKLDEHLVIFSHWFVVKLALFVWNNRK